MLGGLLSKPGRGKGAPQAPQPSPTQGARRADSLHLGKEVSGLVSDVHGGQVIVIHLPCVFPSTDGKPEVWTSCWVGGGPGTRSPAFTPTAHVPSTGLQLRRKIIKATGSLHLPSPKCLRAEPSREQAQGTPHWAHAGKDRSQAGCGPCTGGRVGGRDSTAGGRGDWRLQWDQETR